MRRSIDYSLMYNSKMRQVNSVRFGKIPTSEKEIKDLIKAWLAISLAFGIFIGREYSVDFYMSFIISSITVGTAFIAHELAHKILAQKYGCFAEFRSFDSMLILAIVMSYFLGIIFAAPGAVMIKGPVGVRRNGKISAAGPAVNIILAIIFIVILFSTSQGILYTVALIGALVNAWLAIFNILPFGMFDGKKIIAWNKPIFFLLLISAIIIFIIAQSFFVI